MYAGIDDDVIGTWVLCVPPSRASTSSALGFSSTFTASGALVAAGADAAIRIMIIAAYIKKRFNAICSQLSRKGSIQYHFIKSVYQSIPTS
jgi:hypothetical protein